MRKIWLVIIANCLLLSQGYAAQTTTIAAFGDSLFTGYGLSDEDSFPSQLEQKLRADGYAITMINDGVSGDTTAGGVSRVDQVIAQKPDIIMLDLGGNDLLRAVPPAETRKNLETIMEHIKQAHIRTILIGQKAPLTLGAAYASAYNSLFPDIAASYGAVLYPFFLEGVYNHPELMQADGVHPTKDGIVIMVNSLYPLITAGLKK